MEFGKMARETPVTTQVARHQPTHVPLDFQITDVESCVLYDRHGVPVPFQSLYEEQKCIIIFVRHFLCYTCKEYVEDLSKISQDALRGAGVRMVIIGQSAPRHIEPFCSLTGSPHEVFVDPERHIYSRLGLRRGEIFMESASASPHVKSSMLMGSLKSMWRAMNSPAFDFQGDPLQQGGTLIVGPGPEVHFTHFDNNRLDHMPIHWLLQLAGLPPLDLRDHYKVIDI
ncbi:peroxiredoxin-like 2C [Sardina pilchardus]|uniref:peroxiredoxin-like 2C n=1 Tax=Sardina pilchardus TaxID=27697 RepID=UPI002E10A4A8